MKETALSPEFDIPDALRELAREIRLVLFDVDGVLTDGRLYFDDSGNELKAFHSRDGLGINMLQGSGVEVGIITARKSNVVAHRAQDLKIRHLYQGAKDKYPAYVAMCKSLSLSPAQVVFVGDDVVDLPIMLDVGLAITVPGGHHLVKQNAHWTTPNSAGEGAARDVCELIIDSQGNYESAMKPFLTRHRTA